MPPLFTFGVILVFLGFMLFAPIAIRSKNRWTAVAFNESVRVCLVVGFSCLVLGFLPVVFH